MPLMLEVLKTIASGKKAKPHYDKEINDDKKIGQMYCIIKDCETIATMSFLYSKEDGYNHIESSRISDKELKRALAQIL